MITKVAVKVKSGNSSFIVESNVHHKKPFNEYTKDEICVMVINTLGIESDIDEYEFVLPVNVFNKRV